MTEEDSSQRQLAVRIVENASQTERDALQLWVLHLLEIRESELPAFQKAKKAISVTLESDVVWPAVKIVAFETKRLAWDERGLKGRLGLGGAAVGLALFGSQGAGIAALGTAIGVPLWVVLGAGAAFAGVLYEELTGSEGKEENSKPTYRVIDAEEERSPPSPHSQSAQPTDRGPALVIVRGHPPGDPATSRYSSFKAASSAAKELAEQGNSVSVKHDEEGWFLVVSGGKGGSQRA